jgi:hypothetical protein
MSYLATLFIDGSALSRVANGTFVRWHTSLLCIFVLRQIGDTASVPPYLALAFSCWWNVTDVTQGFFTASINHPIIEVTTHDCAYGGFRHI